MDMAYVLEGQPGGEGRLVTESSWTLWDDFIWNDPDASVPTDLEEGHIIGLGWMYLDGNDEGDRHWFYCGGSEVEDQWRTSASISDFLLKPLDRDVWNIRPPYCPGPEVDDDSVVIWESWRPIKADSSGIYSLSFSPDGHTLASPGVDGTIQLWDVSTGTLQATLEAPGRYIVAFSPDGRTLAVGCSRSMIWLWDVRSGQLDSSLTMDGSASSLAFSPDGSTLAVGSGGENTVELWDVKTGQFVTSDIAYVCELSIMAICESLAFSPDGETLACGVSGGDLRLFEVGAGRRVSGELPKRAPKRTEQPCDGMAPFGGKGSVSFSPDGSKLAYGTYRGTALMDMDSRQPLRRIEDRGYVAFSPDGHTLAIQGHPERAPEYG